MDALGAFAARGGVDLDLALERLVFVGEPDVAFTAAEQRLEHGAEVVSDFSEGLQEQGLGGLIDLAGRLLQRVTRGHEVVALRHQELEPLHFLGMLLHRQRIDGAHGIDLSAQPVVLLAQPFDVAGDLGGFGQEPVERLAPFGLHALDEPAPAPFDLGALELQAMLFLAQGFERLAGLVECALALRQVGFCEADMRPGFLGGGLELHQREPAFLERVLPLGALGGERGAVALDPRDLFGPRGRLLARFSGLRRRPIGTLARCGEACLDLCGLYLPPHALFARRFLLCLESLQPRALCTQLLVGPHPLQLPLLELGVQRAQPGIDFGEPARETLDLRRGFLALAAGVNDGPLRLALFRSRLELGVARSLRRVARRGERRLRRGQLLHCPVEGRAGAIARRGGFPHFLLQRLELGAPLQRPTRAAGRRRRAVQEDRPVGAAQGPAREDFVPGEERAHPGRRGPVHAQLVLQGMAIGGEPGTRDAGEEHERSGLRFRVPGPNRLDGRRVAYQYRVEPFAQQALGQLRIAPAGADEVRQGPDDGVAEPLTRLEERLRGGGEAHALAVELGECIAPCLELCQGGLGVAPGGARPHLLFLQGGHLSPGVL